MKIYCYAIAKNETKNVEAWVRSMRESDGMFICDTGSTDDTVTKLRELGVNVRELPMLNGTFRFDKARNAALDMVPEDADLCVSTDVDETYNPGWRKILEEQWTEALKKNPKLKHAEYDYVLGRDESGKVLDKFNGFRIHVRKGAHWKYACHEVLAYDEPDSAVFIHGITLDHHKDTSKPRSSYVTMLELDCKENPNDPRPAHYLGREYMYLGRWDDSITELKRHLSIKGAWVDERAQSMRFIGYCYKMKNEIEMAECWYLRAIAESKNQREAALDLSQMALEHQEPELGSLAAQLALRVRHKNGTYLTQENSWGSMPYDYISIGESYSKTGDFHLRAKAVSRALELDMYDKRIWRNLINCNGRSPVYPAPKEATAVLENWKTANCSNTPPNWGMFDRIFCIHYVGNTMREAGMKSEFTRVGLWGRDNFEIVETVRSPYEKHYAEGGDPNPGIRNLALNTLRVLLRSQVHGHKRILIMEDDVRFLKDDLLLANILKDSPDSDIVCYDKMNYLFPPEYWELCEKRKLNNNYAAWDNGIYSGAMYSLSEKGMEACIGEYNKHLVAPDDALQVGGVSKAFSYVSLSCQECHKDALYLERYGGYNMKNGYAFQGLDYALYNVSEGYGYDKSFNDYDLLGC